MRPISYPYPLLSYAHARNKKALGTYEIEMRHESFSLVMRSEKKIGRFQTNVSARLIGSHIKGNYPSGFMSKLRCAHQSKQVQSPPAFCFGAYHSKRTDSTLFQCYKEKYLWFNTKLIAMYGGRYPIHTLADELESYG